MTEILEVVQAHQTEVVRQIGHVLLVLQNNPALLYATWTQDETINIYGRLTHNGEIQIHITKGDVA